MASGKQDSSARSGSSADSEPLFINPTNDATFQSLKRLLSAPSTSTQHLSLLSTNTLYGSITYYLSKLELDHVADFAGVVSASGCLWTPPPPDRAPEDPSPVASGTAVEGSKLRWSTDAGSSENSSGTAATSNSASQLATPEKAPQSLSAFLIGRSSSISHAVAAALQRRVALLIDSKNGSAGWATRRAIKLWISSIVAGMSAVEAASAPQSHAASRGLPVPRLAILTGLLQGLYLMRDQYRGRRNMSILEELAAIRANPSLRISPKPFLPFVEDEWIVAFAEVLEALSGDAVPSGPSSSPDPSAAASTGSIEDDADEWEREFRKRTVQLAGSAQITALASHSAKVDAVREIQDVPLYLAAQLAPLMPDRKLQALDTDRLVRVTSEAVLSLFEDASSSNGSLISALIHDTVTDDRGLVHLKSDGITARRTQAIMANTLYSSLGPLSKLLSKALAREATTKDPDSVGVLLLGDREQPSATVAEGPVSAGLVPILVRMDRLAKTLETSWLSSPLAGVEETAIGEDSRPLTTQLWTIFKTLLFSYTMVFDSLMDAIVEMCPSPTITLPPLLQAASTASGPAGPQTPDRRWPPASTSNLPPAYISIVQSILQTFSRLYWITSTFGSGGFDVYRKVFFSALDVIGRDGEGCVALLERIRPDAERADSSAIAARTESNVAKRSVTTYFLDVSEQLVSVLPDEVIEHLLLPTCRPYLEDTQFRDAFESAHSVALSIYANRRRSMFGLAPFYVDLLLKSFPSLLDSTQLEYALSTIVTALSDRSDSMAWWTIERLADEVERERLASLADRGGGSHTDRLLPSPTGSDVEAEPTRGEVLAAEAGSDSVRSGKASTPSSGPAPGDASATSTTSVGGQPVEPSRQVSLQLCLIACVPCVNLVLLRSILHKVEGYILEHRKREEGAEAVESRKLELCEKTFNAIQGLNASTREEGLRWWLEQRDRFGV